MAFSRRNQNILTANDADVLIGQIFSRASAQARSDLGDLSQVDVPAFAKEKFRRVLFNYQVEIIQMLWDLNIREADIIAARQCGKTDAATIGCIALAAANYFPTLEGYTAVGWFANKEDQSVGIGGARCWRLLEGNYDQWSALWDRDGSTKSHLVFKKDAGTNTRILGTLDFRTANPQAFSEGQTYSVMVVDEANRLDDVVWSEILQPMLGSVSGKVIKIGVPRHRNHFYESAHDKTWYHIRVDWTKADMFKQQNPVDLSDPITGQLLGSYGGYPLKRMPLSLKRQLFPTNPIRHVLATKTGIKEEFGRLWDWPGSMSEEDFLTQYALQWLVDVSLFLKIEEQKELFEKGKHRPMTHGVRDELYFYGYDPCGEERIDGFGSERTKKANAALTIWRRNGDATLDKVYCDERRTGTPVEQVRWVEQICHPQTGLFKCVAGCWDATGIGSGTVNEAQRRGLPILPISYPMSCPETGKNWKNSIFDWFKLQIGLERVHYPSQEAIVGEKIVAEIKDDDDEGWRYDGPGKSFLDHKEEWEHVEKKVSSGINSEIRAPGNHLDDGPNSDCLAVWLADHYPQYRNQLGVKTRATRAVRGSSVMSSNQTAMGPVATQYPVHLS